MHKHSGEIKKTLKRRFEDYFTPLMCSPYQLDRLWTDLDFRYSSEKRFYHTWLHIDQMFRLRDRYVYLSREPDILEAAIWFHDAVYQPKSSQNEEASARLAETFLLHSSMRKERVHRVKALIRSTAYIADASALQSVNSAAPKGDSLAEHSRDSADKFTQHADHAYAAPYPASKQSLPEEQDIFLLHDLDFSILRSPRRDFLIYEEGIRREYGHVDEGEYRKRRGTFLQGLLSGGIYHLDIFRKDFEDQAEENIRSLLSSWFTG